jgi:C_GCAxxG_C_C family probable redox protein
MIDKIAQRSGDLFESGMYCAESVLLAVAESAGIQSELIPKIATGFCGGVSRTCGMCGAVSGAIMVIGIFAGRNEPTETVAESYTLVRKLVTEFTERFGSTNCKDLTGCDLGTDEGQKYFKDNNIRQKCIAYTEEATRISLSLIREKLHGGQSS